MSDNDTPHFGSADEDEEILDPRQISPVQNEFSDERSTIEEEIPPQEENSEEDDITEFFDDEPVNEISDNTSSFQLYKEDKEVKPVKSKIQLADDEPIDFTPLNVNKENTNKESSTEEEIKIPKVEETQEEAKESEIKRKEKYIDDTLKTTGQKKVNADEYNDEHYTAKTKLDSNPFKEVSDKNFQEFMGEHITNMDNIVIFPPASIREWLYSVANNQDIIDTESDRGKLISEMISEGFKILPASRFGHTPYNEPFEDDQRYFVQGLSDGAKPLKPGTSKVSSKNLSSQTGEKAALRLNSLLGRSSLFKLPLWNSGFWVYIKSPSDAQLVDLYFALQREKIRLGRDVTGAIFSNDSVYMASMVCDLFLDCVQSTSLQIQPSELLNYITLPDLQIIAWGLMSAAHPNGFYFSRSVLADDGTNDKLVSGKVRLEDLMFVDKNALSDSQKRHMVKTKPGTMSIDSVNAYQENLFPKVKKDVVLYESEAGKLIINFKTPKIAEYIEYGEKWINSIIDSLSEALASEGDDERNRIINAKAKASIIWQYGHYVESIIFKPNDLNEKVDEWDDDDTIDVILRDYSQEDSSFKAFMDGVFKFIDSTPVALVATPTTTYKEDEAMANKFPNLIPIDALYTFFTQAAQRVEKVTSRQGSMS